MALNPLSPEMSCPDKRLINIKVQSDGWILEKMAERLTEIPGVSLSPQVDNDANLNYFFNYHQFESTNTPTAAWFTHIEERIPASVSFFWEVAEAVDICIFHSDLYRDIVQRNFPLKHCLTISPGVDLNLFSPRNLRVGVIGRGYPETGRKNEELLQQIISAHHDIDWIVTGVNWGIESVQMRDSEMPDIYRSLDFLLVTSHYEGGPMSVLEALASGVQVIAHEIGWVPELPHISYETANFQQLNTILEQLKSPARRLRSQITHRTWDNFVAQHKEIFDRFLN